MSVIHSFSDGGGKFSVVMTNAGRGEVRPWLEFNQRTVDPDSFGDALLRELARLATQKAENLPNGSREVADLIERLDRQKARAEMAEAATQSVMRIMGTINEERNGFCRQLAVLEGELAAAKTAAAGRARTEGDPRRFAQLCEMGGSLFAVAADGSGWVQKADAHWLPLPPLPPIEPAKAGAEECEPSVKPSKF